MNIRGDIAQVLGKKWKSTECFADPLEQVVVRSVYPTAIDGGFFLCGNFPELREATEMIEANVIEVMCRPAQAIDPPRIPLFSHDVPPIERAAPALASLAEEIRRDTRYDLGLKD